MSKVLLHNHIKLFLSIRRLWKGLDWTYQMQVSNLLFSDDFILRRSPLMFIIECNWKLFPHFKCRLKMSLPIYPIKPITWMKFLLQLSEWKNYCHFLWLSIYILLLGFAARSTSTRNFSARIISKSNFSFHLGKRLGYHMLLKYCSPNGIILFETSVLSI